MPFNLATVGFGYVPLRSPPAAPPGVYTTADRLFPLALITDQEPPSYWSVSPGDIDTDSSVRSVELLFSETVTKTGAVSELYILTVLIWRCVLDTGAATI